MSFCAFCAFLWLTKDRLGEDSQVQRNLRHRMSAAHGRVMGQEREFGAAKITKFQVLSDGAGKLSREIVAAKRKQGRRGGTSGGLPERRC